MSSNEVSSRKFAALAFALGLVRAQLSAVLDGGYEKSEASRILRGTSLANIAKAIGVTEEELVVDWDEQLSEIERGLIEGATRQR